MRPGGSLTESKHKDTGSLITIDLMLSDTSGPDPDFTGGELCTPDENWSRQVLVLIRYQIYIFVPVGARKKLAGISAQSVNDDSEHTW